MPPLPDAPNVLRVDVHWNYGGDTSLSTRNFMHYSGGAPSATSLNTFCAAALTSAGTQFAPLMDVNSAVVGVTAVDLTSPTSGAGAATGTHSGTRAGQPVPAQSCILENLVINRRYRGGKPRRYWPFGTAGDLADPQNWSATFRTACETAITAWLTSLTTSPPAPATIDQFVNVSYYEGVNPPITLPSGRVKQSAKVRTAPIVDGIAARSINSKVGSQRRRIAA